MKLLERFNAKWTPEPFSGCWLWHGAIGHRGYGVMRDEDSVMRNAHRISWKLKNGPISAELVVMHKCDTPACVNPDHLCSGTQKENMMDASRKGRLAYPRPLLRGENNPASKLTDSAVRHIRISSDTYPKLAAKYGVSAGLIGHVKRGIVWRYLS